MNSKLIDFNCYWASAVAAGASAIGGIAGSLLSNSANSNLNQKNRQWQSEETEKARQYNTSERLSQQDWQKSFYDYQNQYNENLYNKYNSPEALARQFKEAGFNPNLAVDSSSVASAASGSSAPSGSGVSFPGVPSNPYNYDFAGSFIQVAQALQAISSAKKAGAETSQIEKSLDKFLKSIDLNNEQQELFNSVNKKYLDKRTNAELQQILQGIKLGDISYKEFEQKVKLLEKENIIKSNEVSHWDEQFFAGLDNLEADTRNKLMSANYTRKQAENYEKVIDNIVSDTVKNYALAHNLDVNSDQIEELKPLVKDSIQASIDNTNYDSDIKILDALAKEMENVNLVDFGSRDAPSRLESLITSLVRENKSTAGKARYAIWKHYHDKYK